MHKIRFLLSAFAALLLLLSGFNAFAANINDIRVWNSPDRTRIVFDLSGPVEYKYFELKTRIGSLLMFQIQNLPVSCPKAVYWAIGYQRCVPENTTTLFVLCLI